MWSHRSIADSRLGQRRPSVPAICPLGQIVPPWSDGDGLLPRGHVPTTSFQHNQIPGATGATAVSH